MGFGSAESSKEVKQELGGSGAEQLAGLNAPPAFNPKAQIVGFGSAESSEEVKQELGGGSGAEQLAGLNAPPAFNPEAQIVVAGVAVPVVVPSMNGVTLSEGVPPTHEPAVVHDAESRAVHAQMRGSHAAAVAKKAIAGTRQARLDGKWIPDEDVSRCMSPVCDKTPPAKFGKKTRRHHCRCCGLVVCKKCLAGSKLSVDKWIDKDTRALHEPNGELQEVKVCKSCYKQVPDEMKERHERRTMKSDQATAMLQMDEEFQREQEAKRAEMMELFERQLEVESERHKREIVELRSRQNPELAVKLERIQDAQRAKKSAREAQDVFDLQKLIRAHEAQWSIA